MENKPRVVVQPPDSRGLREVSIGGKTVGRAWSLRGLRKILSRLGYPESIDLENRASVCWRECGSDTWPDRTWRRRAVTVLMMAGLFGSMVLLIKIGTPDALSGLTFAGRISGTLFVIAGAVEGLAALAALDYFGKRQVKYSGAAVSLGALISLATDSLLLFLWFQEMESTPYLWVYLPLWIWSIWALWALFHEKAWRGIPHPKKFAAGVVITAVLGAANVAYSTLYQPTVAPLVFSAKAKFGAAYADPQRPVTHLPISFRAKNEGKVPAYILIDQYWVYGLSGKHFSQGKELRDQRKAAENEGDTGRFVGYQEQETIETGPFQAPGGWLEPGEEHIEEKVIEIPREAKYDTIRAGLLLTLMRKDHGKIDMDEFSFPRFSWNKSDKDVYCPPGQCIEHVQYHARILSNNNLVNVTRRPRYVTAFWFLDAQNPSILVDISTSETSDYKSIEGDSESERERSRYDIVYAENEAAIPFTAVRNPPRT